MLLNKIAVVGLAILTFLVQPAFAQKHDHSTSVLIDQDTSGIAINGYVTLSHISQTTELSPGNRNSATNMKEQSGCSRVKNI